MASFRNDRPRVVIVNDKPKYHDKAREAAVQAGFDPVIASDYISAMTEIDTHLPHGVVLDWQLAPGAQGIHKLILTHTSHMPQVVRNSLVEAMHEDPNFAQRLKLGEYDHLHSEIVRIRGELEKNGVKMAEELLEKNPNLHVVITTGGTYSQLERKATGLMSSYPKQVRIERSARLSDSNFYRELLERIGKK